MRLHRRLAFIVACAVAIAVATILIAATLLFDQRLRGEVDASLRKRAATVLHENAAALRQPNPHLPTAGDLYSGGYLQQIIIAGPPDAQPAADSGPGVLPGIATDVARGTIPDAFFDVAPDASTHLRMYVLNARPGVAVLVGRPVDDIDQALRQVRLVALLIGAAGTALAGLLGWLTAITGLRPISRLANDVTRTAATRDLHHRIPAGRRDELGALATSVNSLLDALDEAQQARQQLVADASHELRSPLASMRTNIEVLARADQLPDTERTPLINDVLTQITELSALVDDLLMLARDPRTQPPPERVMFDDLVAEATTRIRTRARTRSVRLDIDLQPCVVTANPSHLERAVTNLLDNAIKWSPSEGTVQIRLSQRGELTVHDQGPGIDPADLPHIFERFYRARAARPLPGSGLGLAIVHKIATEAGGTITAEPGLDGGTTMRMTLPSTE